MNDKKMGALIKRLHECDTHQLAQVIEEIRHLRPIVGHSMTEDTHICCEYVAVIDDAIRLIFNPKEIF
jgi:hypothetical protein